MPKSKIPLNTLSIETNDKVDLIQLSKEQPVLLIFLRHFGCTFCREALHDLSDKKAEIAHIGTKMVFVHMSDKATADKYFKRYNLEGSTHISDPDCKLYQEFGLVKGSFNQLFGLKVWLRGMDAGLLKGHGIGRLIGDGFQMPGIFLLKDGEVYDSFVHNSAADRPDYMKLATCCQFG